MATFDWKCDECKIFWDREYPVGKAPDRTRCPVCKKLSDRFWENQNLQHSWGDDMDFHAHRARVKKFQEDGYDKTAGDRWLRRQISDSKAAMDDESNRYRRFDINWKKLAEEGKATKLNDKQTAEKIERSKKLTAEAYDNANKRGHKHINKDHLDITKDT
jgi:hypothetical protein